MKDSANTKFWKSPMPGIEYTIGLVGLSTTENVGILREKTWLDNQQPFGPSAIPYCPTGTPHCSNQSTFAINSFSNYFPGVSIFNVLGYQYNPLFPGSSSILNIGPNAEGQAPNTGAFQNRLEPSGVAVWTLGRQRSEE